MQVAYYILLSLFVLSSCRILPPKTRKLLVIVFDGFSKAYVNHEELRTATGKLNNLCARARGVIPAYPVNFVANAYSLATGVESRRHGVMSERLYDIKYEKEISWLDREMYPPNIAPIWITNQATDGMSGCMMYPGGEFQYGDEKCRYVTQINSRIDHHKRLEKALQWLKLDKGDNANFVMMSVDEPSKTAKQYGVYHEKTISKVRELIEFMIGVVNQSKEIGLHTLNILFLGSHGLGEATDVIDLAPIIGNEKFGLYGSNGMMQVVPQGGTASVRKVFDKLYDNMEKLGYTAYRTDMLPEKWKCSHPSRGGPIMVVAKKGSCFAVPGSKKPEGENATIAVDGYEIVDDTALGMAYGCGPQFREGYEGGLYDMKYFYTLLCTLLGIAPDNNSDVDEAQRILKMLRAIDPTDPKTFLDSVAAITGGVVCMIMVLCGGFGWRRISNKTN